MNLREQLRRAVQGNVVVMGIGNRCRGDDAAGSCLAQRIHGAPGVLVIDAQDVPENYLCRVADQRPDTVVLVDSVDMKSAPGSVAFFENGQTLAYWPSTHRVPLNLIVDYLERTTSACIVLIAIQPQHTDLLGPTSPAVLSSVEAIAHLLNDVLDGRPTAGLQPASPAGNEVPA